MDEAQAAALRARYNLDQPFMVQYWRWLKGMVRGDLGMSFEWNRPVTELIGERILLTSIISIVTLLVTWALAIPVGILFGCEAVFTAGLLFYVFGLYRACNAQFFARAHFYVHRVFRVWG